MHACLLCEGKFRCASIDGGTGLDAESKLMVQQSLAIAS